MTDYGSPRNKPVKGTYSHSNLTTEQDVLIFTRLKKNIEVSFTMTNLVQNTTLRVYEKNDDATYEISAETIYPTDYGNEKNALMELIGKGVDTKITFQSGTLEGSAKNVPHARSVRA